ncbi:MAG: lipopolysaccharide biosynthesis protein [Acidimicrobiales bacterium]|nr:lipopolysaccharide biosynthesis protein [Acidimicrobiales bacterium]
MVRDKLQGLLSSRLGRNTGWALFAELAQVGSGLAIFVVLIIALEPAEYGRYAAVGSLAVIAGALAHAGSQFLMIERVSRGGDVTTEWGHALGTTLVGTTLATVILLAFQPVTEVAVLPFLLLVFAQLSCRWLAETGVSVGTGLKRLDISFVARAGFATARLIGLALFWFVADHTLESWARWGAVGAGAGVVFAIGSTTVMTGVRPSLRPPTVERLRRGLPYAGTGGTQSLIDGSDRPILVANGFAADAGRYALAYRIALLGSIPLQSWMRASSADFFQKGQGASGARANLGVASRMTKRAIPFSVAIGVGLAVLAGLGEVVYDGKYDGAQVMLLTLAALPLVKALQLPAGNALTGADHQLARVGILFSGAILNLVLNLVLVPRYSWKAAVATTFVAEVAVIIGFWLALRHFATADEQRGSPSPDYSPPRT